MLSVKSSFKFILAFIFITSLTLTGCGSLPWSNDKDDDDLFFEEDFGSEFESEFEDVPPSNKEAESKPGAETQPKDISSSQEEDDFFKDDEVLAQSQPKTKPKPRTTPVSPDEEDFFFEDDAKVAQSQPKAKPLAIPPVSSDEDDFFFEDEPTARTVLKSTTKLKPQKAEKIEQKSGVISNKGSGTIKGRGGFVSVDQKTDKEEINVDVATLHSQQEALLFRVQELQKIVSNLEPRLAATQERVGASLSAGSGSRSVNEEIQFLKAEVVRLKSEMATIKRAPVHSKQAKMVRKARPMKRLKQYPKISRAPKKYNEALAAYKAGKYDKSILLFKEMSLGNPPQNLRDNIVFWMGSNYLKLDMYDDAIKQYQTVLSQYPDGNKVHDARYMLGVSYQKKGDTGRALDALEVALKSNPPTEVRQKIEKQLMEIK
jgi:TolA-binding protein